MRALCSVLAMAAMCVSNLLALDIATAYQDVYPKFIIRDGAAEPELSGLCVEIERAVERADPSIRFVAESIYTPFPRIEAGLASGVVEAFCGLTKTPEREAKYLFVMDLYQTGMRIVARSDEEAEIRSLDDIKKLGNDVPILALAGTVQAAYLREQGFLVDDGGTSVEQNLQKLMIKRGRFFYQSDLSVFAAIRDMKLSSKVKVYPTVMSSSWQSFVFSKRAPVEKVEAAKSALLRLKKSGELDRIVGEYLSAE